ncbi:MAG TPA: hypothetical protein VE782_07615 [Myxococcaceae bacterium]|nr:hypothetical protein [Myxococcaceae bacterium]
MSRARGISMALALAAAGAPAEGVGRKRADTARPAPMERRLPGLVKVEYVTASRAYLDRGAEDGIAAGESLPFARDGRPAGDCRIETLGPHSATCTGAPLKPGDTAPLRPVQVKREEVRIPQLPAVPSAAELGALRDRLVGAVVPLVKARLDAPAPGLVSAPRGSSSVALRHQAWVSAASDRGTWNQERLQLAMAGMPVAAGTRLFLDLSTVSWTQRPATFLSPHRAQTQVFVYEAALTRRDPGDTWVGSAGRVWPWRAAGLGVLDGAQVGWRSGDGTLELGGFGGIVPDALNLAPDLSRPMFGAYGAYTHASDGAIRWLQQEARVNYASAPARLEAELWTRAGLARWADAGIGARFTSSSAGGRLIDTARFDLRTHPGAHIDLFAAARYEAAPMEVLPAVGEVPLGHRSVRADAGASFKTAGWLSAGLIGGYSRDLENDAVRAWAGPQIQAPALVGGRLGLFAAYEEEIGWVGGRSAWLQGVVRPAERLNLLGRLSWFQSGPEDGPRGAEAGTYLGVRYDVTRAWDVSISMLTRWRIEPAADVPPFGLTGTGALAAQF